MKFNGFKYILIACIALAFFLKVSHVVSYLSYSDHNVELLSTNDDATEKEEKKIESEFAVYEVLFNATLYFPFQSTKKVIIPDHSFQLAYFPEVLTPPPSI
ncbi:hypothetical protein OQX63_14000 [Pedobacter sp. PF22-3]|jgi:hypothetical protein|uniref:hypothetical protein n=1 Tax=Pedobacter sp. PF22-3 TaxID=2994467 RepID=UPI0022471720|nr:hypothetical protein [Pedobacter sp. PF22-3]MCX2494598.1 hypothetical protein [Pedobacter sp. PF22-3]